MFWLRSIYLLGKLYEETEKIEMSGYEKWFLNADVKFCLDAV